MVWRYYVSPGREEAQLISDIGTQVSDIARTEDAIAAAQKASEKRQSATQEERGAAKAEWESLVLSVCQRMPIPH
jgi:hypothetical protein